MTGLYLRGERWWLRYQLNGRQVRVPLGTRDRADAEAEAERILTRPDVKEARSWETEVNEYLAARVSRRKMSQNAADSRRTVLLRFGRETGVYAPQMLSTRVLQDWYEETLERTEPTTAETYVRWLRTFHSHLTDQGFPVRPLGEIETERVSRALRKPFCSAEQVRAIKQATDDPELLFILYCGFDAGLRRGEIAEARPEWFDLKAGALKLERSATWEPKDQDARTIPLTEDFRAFLDVYGLRSPFMLAGKAKKSPRKWRYRYDPRAPFEDLMRRLNPGRVLDRGPGQEPIPLGIDPAVTHGRENSRITMHAMRRTFASLKVSAGVSLYKVAVWLGDLERVVQESYGYLIPKDADIERGM